MFLRISVVPPSIEFARARRKRYCQRASAGADVHRELGERLVHLGPVPLAERPLGARRVARQTAVGGEPQHVRLRDQLAVALADHGVAVQPGLADEIAQLAQGDLDPHLQREGQAGALVHERGDRHRPAVALPADDVLVRDPRLLEEQLVELGLAGDLHQRPDLHAVLLHVEQEVGEAPVLRRVRVGAGDEHAPLGLVRVGGPHLLAGHDPLVAVPDRAGLERGEVGARLGLREALAPDLVGGQDRRQVALLLLVGAVGDDGRAAHGQAEHVGHRGRARARQLLVEDRLLDLRGAGAAVLGRPVQARPAAVVQRPLPGLAELELLGVGVRLAAGVVLLYPAADGVTELTLDRRQAQVHGPGTLPPPRAARAGAARPARRRPGSGRGRRWRRR